MASTSRNKPLSKKEQQEEEMRERIKESGFYFENMSFEEMKDVEKALNNTSDAETASTSAREFKTTKNTSDLSELIPAPSYSYRKSNTRKYSPDQFQRGENSEYDSMANKSNLNNDNSNSDSKSIYNKNTNFTNENYPPLTTKSNMKHNNEKFQPRESKRIWNQKRSFQDRWRLNPLAFCDDDNDVPLQQPERVHITNGESLPYLKSDDVDDETFQMLCQQMNEKLDTLHNQFTVGSGDSKWGAPIKATGKWIEPLELQDNTAPCETQVLHSDNSPEVPFRDTRERATKRKALSIIHAACVNDSSDENSESEFENKKKRKCLQGKKGEQGRKNHGNLKNTSRASSIDMIDVSDSNNMQENLDAYDSADEIKEEAIYDYPRRIIPPNPAQKKNFKGPRGRKRTIAQSQNSSLQKCLNDEEIQKTLNALDDCIDITPEIKPAEVPKNISDKISIARTSLQKARVEEEEKIKAAEKAKEQKEKEELMKKDELISKRMQEKEDELQRKAEEDRKLRERDESFRSRTASKNPKITRSSFRNRSPTEEQLLDAEDNDIITVNEETLTRCPICGKDFPNEQIETHASECDAFSSVSDEINIYQPSTSRSREMDYKCDICNRYRTYNGNDYNDHVTKCKEKAEDRRNGIYV